MADVTDIEKFTIKVTMMKAGALVLSACIMSATAATYMKDWQDWRKGMEQRTSDTERTTKELLQWRHDVTAYYLPVEKKK